MNPNWPIKKLGELIKIESGKRPKGGSVEYGVPSIGGEQLLPNGKINWDNLRYIPEDFYNSLTKGKVLEGDVLVVKDGATTGKTCYVEKLIFPKVAVNEHVFILRSRNPNVLLNKFLFYLLFSDIGQKQIYRIFHGSTHGGITQEDIKNLTIPLPPLEIQKKIVAKIEELFEKIDKIKELRKKVLEETEEIFQSALQEIFDKAEKKWGIVKILDISETKPQYGYTESAQESPVGPKFLRITDIQNGKVDWGKVPFCRCSSKDFEKYKLENGDILFARTGATTGKTYLITELPQETIFGSYLIRLKINKSKASPEYVYEFFQSPQYWQQITPYGGAQPNMNARLLSKIKLPLPPLSEQKRIVAYLDNLREKIEKLKRLQEEQLKDLEELKKSILEKAFQGELVK